MAGTEMDMVGVSRILTLIHICYYKRASQIYSLRFTINVFPRIRT